MLLKSWLQQSQQHLQASTSAKLDTEVLAAFVLNRTRAWIMGFADSYQLTDAELQALQSMLARRYQGEPIAHLTGQREFWSLNLRVNASTLIPRPDTEILVEQALLKIVPDQAVSVLDLGTGTGAIALALAKERPLAQLTGVDCLAEIIALAEENAQNLAVSNCRFFVSDWFSTVINSGYQVIVSNPPYIEENDPHLQQGDVRFEPRSALTAPEQGLACLREIISQSRHYLVTGGWLLLEHGYQQASAVQGLFNAAGYQQVTTVNDYAGNPRVSYGCV
jgi:release factor glutamine methyltransferase